MFLSKKSQQIFHITFVVNVIIIFVDAHENYKPVHRVNIIAQKTWENFCFERQKLMAGGKNAHNYSMHRIQLSACLKSYKGSQSYNQFQS